MKTYEAKPGEIGRKWHIIDATDKVVGRLCTEIANLLRGKDKPTYTPNTDTGDFVVVINAEKVMFTGKKWDQKAYYRHSEWFGGLTEKSAKQVLESEPERIITDAVKGMLPKNKLARHLITKLKVYVGPNHPHSAQKPVAYTQGAN
jgi:large subunit ribosomal protein L13